MEDWTLPSSRLPHTLSTQNFLPQLSCVLLKKRRCVFSNLFAFLVIAITQIISYVNPWNMTETRVVSLKTYVFFPSFFFFFFWPCLMAWGILVPWPGIKSTPSAVKARSSNHWTTREFPKTYGKCFGKVSCLKKMLVNWCGPEKLTRKTIIKI